MANFTINEEKNYTQSQDALFQAVLGAIGGLEGQVQQQDAASGEISAKFGKKILGRVLGDRTELKAQIKADGSGSKLSLEVYPLDPVGRPLKFGARKGVARTVVDWLYAHIDHRLK